MLNHCVVHVDFNIEQLLRLSLPDEKFHPCCKELFVVMEVIADVQPVVNEV